MSPSDLTFVEQPWDEEPGAALVAALMADLDARYDGAKRPEDPHPDEIHCPPLLHKHHHHPRLHLLAPRRQHIRLPSLARSLAMSPPQQPHHHHPPPPFVAASAAGCSFLCPLCDPVAHKGLWTIKTPPP